MCAPSIISNNEVKILCSDGRLLVYTRAAIKAAEVMLEYPGQFLCESKNLKVGQRIPGVWAEEELERGQVYFLLPMEMLYSVLTDDELNSLTNKTTRGLKQHAATLNFSKIFPEFCLFPNASDSTAVEESDAGGGGGSGDCLQRYSRQRSWQPALETIVETPPHS